MKQLVMIKPEDYDLSEVDVLGLGPSLKYYIPSGKTVICIHAPWHELCDITCTNQRGEYGYYGVPSICGCRRPDPSYNDLVDLTSFEHPDSKKVSVTGWNVWYNERLYNFLSGQIALIWLKAWKAEKVNLWGFDSIWELEYRYASKTEQPVLYAYDDIWMTRYKKWYTEILDNRFIIHKNTEEVHTL